MLRTRSRMPKPARPSGRGFQSISRTLSRWESALDKRLRERVTQRGVFFLAALTLVGLAAFASANNLLFLLLAAMLAILMVSGFVSRLGLSGLELDVQLPEHISARQPTSARVSLKNEKGWAPSFSIHVVGIEDSVFSTPLYFPSIAAGGTLEETVDVRFARRGLYRQDNFQFSSRFPFGFAERRVNVTMTRDVLVYPCLDPQPPFEQLLAEVAGDVEQLFRGRGHDFYRIRPYEALESARHVDWKASAHTGALQVREFAKEQETLVSIFLDIDAPDTATVWFEQAIECAAFLTVRLSNRGTRVHFRTQTFDLRVPLEGDAYTILKYLALVERRRAPALRPILDEDCVPIALSADPQRLRNSGWSGLRILGLDAFAGADTPAHPDA